MFSLNSSSNKGNFISFLKKYAIVNVSYALQSLNKSCPYLPLAGVHFTQFVFLNF